MNMQTENSKLKTLIISAHFAVTAVTGTLMVAFAGTFVFLNINMNRPAGKTDRIHDYTGFPIRDVFGSQLIGLTVICIIVSLLLLAVILFFLFYRNGEKATGKWIDYIEPVSSEPIEEKDQFHNRTRIIVDTTERSKLTDGEFRFRGRGGFISLGDQGPEHTDSDGDPSH